MKLSELLQKDNEWKNMDVEKCSKCGHIVAKSDMQEVLSGNFISDLAKDEHVDSRTYYCSNCEKGYDYYVINGGGGPYYYKKQQPYIKVYENGTIIPTCSNQKCPRAIYPNHDITWPECISKTSNP